VRHEPFVYFDDIKDWVFRVDPLEIIDDLPDRRLGQVEIEAGLRV
jgi:hypothetical protein